MRRRLLSIGVLGLLGVVFALSGAASASAASPPVWGSAIEVPGTAALNIGGGAQVNSVSCAAAGTCTAGGYYYDGVGRQQAFVADETSGAWGTASEVPGTAALNAGGAAVVTSVSCSSPGNCSAGGTYTDSKFFIQVFVANETNGTWGTAIEVPGTSVLNLGNAAVRAVSCTTDGNCTATGLYHDSSRLLHAFVVDETSGTWGTAIEVPGIPALNSGNNAQANWVSCSTAGNCSAGGSYVDGSGHQQAFLADETNGTWGNAIEVPGTAALNTGSGGTVRSVSCRTNGTCTAGGAYADSSGKLQAFVVDKTNGAWGSAIEVPGTAALNSGGNARLTSVACGTAGTCGAGGYYVDGSGNQQAFVVDETSGSWGTAIEVPGTAAVNVGGGARVNAVSCSSAGNCAAGGLYTLDEDGDEQAFVVNETNGSWGSAIDVPGMSTLNAGEFAAVMSVSCATDSNCAVGGFYVDDFYEGQAFVADSLADTAIRLTAAGVSATYGSATTSLSATLTFAGSGVPNETVTFALNGKSVGSAMTNANGVATLPNVSLSGINAGFYPGGVAASFAGDGSYAATSGSNALAIARVAQTITITTHAPTDANYGDQFTVAATGGASGNPVYFYSDGACTNSGGGIGPTFTMTSGTGACYVYYDEDGNTNYDYAPELYETVTAHKASQTIQITTHAPSNAPSGTGFTVAAAGGGSGIPIVYGSSGSCTNTGAQFTMTANTGTCTVKYDQAGNGNYSAAPEKTDTVTSGKSDQTITFATPAAHTYGNADFAPGATASSGYAVSYGAAGACSIVSGKIHLTGAGSCTVTADQAGDASYNAAPQVQRTFSVGKAALSITATNEQKLFGQSFTLGTTAFTASGLVGADSVSAVTLTSSGAAAAAASGSYAIVPSNAVAGPSTSLATNYTITFHNGTLQVLPGGIIGLSGVSVAASGAKIDSFDSTLGAYGGLNHGSTALVASNGPLSFSGVSLFGTAVSTQGSVAVASGASVGGNVTAGTTVSNLGHVGGTVTQHAPSGALSLASVVACSSISAKTGISGGKFTYSSGNLTVKSGTVKLASKTYCFNNVTVAAGSTLSVSAAVTINLRGKLTVKGQIVNTANLPARLHIVSSYSGSGGVAIAGGTRSAMTILAPKTGATISGGAFFGTVFAGSVSLTGGIQFHADQH